MEALQLGDDEAATLLLCWLSVNGCELFGERLFCYHYAF